MASRWEYYKAAYQNPVYMEESAGTSPGAATLRHPKLRPFLRPGLVDLGCGRGQGVAALNREGVESVGVDFAPTDSCTIEEDLTGCMSGTRKAGPFVTTFSANTIECLPPAAMDGFLASMCTLARRHVLVITHKRSAEEGFGHPAENVRPRGPAWWARRLSGHVDIRDVVSLETGVCGRPASAFFCVGKGRTDNFPPGESSVDQHVDRVLRHYDLEGAPEGLGLREVIRTVVATRRSPKYSLDSLRELLTSDLAPCILRELSTRWLISISDTFMVFGSPVERFGAATVSTVGQVFKGVDTYVADHPVSPGYKPPTHPVDGHTLTDGQHGPDSQADTGADFLRNTVWRTRPMLPPHLSLLYDVLWLRLRYNSPVVRSLDVRYRLFPQYEFMRTLDDANIQAFDVQAIRRAAAAAAHSSADGNVPTGHVQ